MDGIADENDADLRFFTLAGERIACGFTEEDFLGCPETKQLLVDEEARLFSEVEDQLIGYIAMVYNRERECLSSVFSGTTEGKLAGMLVSLVRSAVVPRYDFAMFGEEPSLAAPLVKMKENAPQ